MSKLDDLASNFSPDVEKLTPDLIKRFLLSSKSLPFAELQLLSLMTSFNLFLMLLDNLD